MEAKSYHALQSQRFDQSQVDQRPPGALYLFGSLLMTAIVGFNFKYQNKLQGVRENAEVQMFSGKKISKS